MFWPLEWITDAGVFGFLLICSSELGYAFQNEGHPKT